MAYETVLYDVQDQILTITLNRPEKLNAFTRGMVPELIDCFDRADADDNVRAIIVTGAGRAFCAGADISQGFDRSARGGFAPTRRERRAGLEPRRGARRRRQADAAHLQVA